MYKSGNVTIRSEHVQENPFFHKTVDHFRSHFLMQEENPLEFLDLCFKSLMFKDMCIQLVIADFPHKEFFRMKMEDSVFM